MRRQGLGTEAIGVFIAALYLPWGFKWIVGPIVDTISSDRFGAARTWIVPRAAGSRGVPAHRDPDRLHCRNQAFHRAHVPGERVQRDAGRRDRRAAAINVLPEHERGVANGASCSAAHTWGRRSAVSAVLYHTDVIPFSHDVPVRRRDDPAGHAVRDASVAGAFRRRRRPSVVGSRMRAVGSQIRTFLQEAWAHHRHARCIPRPDLRDSCRPERMR
jgi:hypothetical protein